MPTPVEVLNENLSKANTLFTSVMEKLTPPEDGLAFENFVYLFE